MLRRILPHVAIVLSNMYIVFYLIDRVNSAMSFIDNKLTKALLVLLSLVSTFNAALLIRDAQKRAAREQARVPGTASRPRTVPRRPKHERAPQRGAADPAHPCKPPPHPLWLSSL